MIKTALLLLTLLGGVSTAWADYDVWPLAGATEETTTYLDITKKTGSMGTDGTGTSAELTYVGSDNRYAEFTVNNENATSYYHLLITLGARSNHNTGVLQITITDVSTSETEIVQRFDILDVTGAQIYSITKAITSGIKKIRFDIVSTTGNYLPNLSKITFQAYTPATYFDGWPILSSSKYIDLTKGVYGTTASTLPRTENNGDNVGFVYDGGYAEYTVYNANASACYALHMGIRRNTDGSKVKVTISDHYTGTIDIQQTFDVPAGSGSYPDCTFYLTKSVSAGIKKIRFDFIHDTVKDNNSSNWLFNYKNVSFAPINNWPLISSSTTLDLTSATYGKKEGTTNQPRWNGSAMDYVETGGYADGLYVNNSTTAYYTLLITGNYFTIGDKVQLTVTDIESGIDEVSDVFTYTTGGNADQAFDLTAKVTPGLKKIRFDFVSIGSTFWMYTATFAVNNRVLDENVNYTPVAATGVDVALTRSITAGNWSTLCLPFDMTAEQVNATFGADTKLAGIKDYTDNTLQAEEITAITANVPCFIKVASDFSSATISGVIIKEGTPEKVISGDFKLVGTYSSGIIANGNYFVSGNQLYKSTGKSKIKPFRAYFTGVPADAKARLAFFDDETTSISDATLLMNNEEINGEVYDLQGRKVDNPVKGLYIVNGKKVLIK